MKVGYSDLVFGLFTLTFMCLINVLLVIRVINIGLSIQDYKIFEKLFPSVIIGEIFSDIYTLLGAYMSGCPKMTFVMYIICARSL